MGDCAALAAVAAQDADPDLVLGDVMVGVHSRAGPVERECGCAIGRAVVDEEDLPGTGVRGEVGDGFSKHYGETGALVVGGDDDGDEERELGLRVKDIREWARGGNRPRGEDGAVELFVGSFRARGVRNEEDEEVGLR